MRRILSGFTLTELVIVVVILGILITLGIGQFTGAREQAMDREAQANLKLIAAAMKIYNLEAGYYLNFTNTSDLNSNLKLFLPQSAPAWRYKVDEATNTVFKAKAARTANNNGTIWCFNQSCENAFNASVAGCSW